MTPEQARERAREIAAVARGAPTGIFMDGTSEASRAVLPLVLSVASEARQEERKRCEEIVLKATMVYGPWDVNLSYEANARFVGLAVRKEILRRIKGSE